MLFSVVSLLILCSAAHVLAVLGIFPPVHIDEAIDASTLMSTNGTAVETDKRALGSAYICTTARFMGYCVAITAFSELVNWLVYAEAGQSVICGDIQHSGLRARRRDVRVWGARVVAPYRLPRRTRSQRVLDRRHRAEQCDMGMRGLSKFESEAGFGRGSGG
ncbi:hypothetical protein B0H19DRAFT_1058440 [Mycena capillaripes]|nr:hypothetical protein B0H19DRAFT_1058440 [Mycena capillaripes]